MRLVSFATTDGPRAGLLRDGRVYDIGGEAFAGVRAADRTIFRLLQGGLLGVVAPEDDNGVPLEELELQPPIARPGKILCIGLNYRAHAEEQGKERSRDTDDLRQVRQRAERAGRRASSSPASATGSTTRPRSPS